MRTNVARGVLVVFTAVTLSGCYSNGGWNMPGRAAAPSNPARLTAQPRRAGEAFGNRGLRQCGPDNRLSGWQLPIRRPGRVLWRAGRYNAPGTGYPPAGQVFVSSFNRRPPRATQRRLIRPAGPARRAMPPRRPARPKRLRARYAHRLPPPYGGTNPYSSPAAVSPYNTSPPASYSSPASYNSAGSAAGGYGSANASSGGYTNPARCSRLSISRNHHAPAATAAARTDTPVPTLPTPPGANPAMAGYASHQLRQPRDSRQRIGLFGPGGRQRLY